jgi:hypothetical protein
MKDLPLNSHPSALHKLPKKLKAELPLPSGSGFPMGINTDFVEVCGST